ncbi:MAG: hypothetical protein HQK97_02930 [Nitrospirae bacterium]|nr:hypothetical protein [Nitrospirota bacterium]
MKILNLKTILNLAKSTPGVFVLGSLVTLFSQSYTMTPGSTELLSRIELRTPTEANAQTIVMDEVQKYLRDKAISINSNNVEKDMSDTRLAASWYEWSQWSQG